ncbi:unnamed protein product, partial [Staurois parvus]
PISATCQCHIVHTSAHQCHPSVPVSATYQCLLVPANSASQCRLTVPVSAA